MERLRSRVAQLSPDVRHTSLPFGLIAPQLSSAMRLFHSRRGFRAGVRTRADKLVARSFVGVAHFLRRLLQNWNRLERRLHQLRRNRELLLVHAPEQGSLLVDHLEFAMSEGLVLFALACRHPQPSSRLLMANVYNAMVSAIDQNSREAFQAARRRVVQILEDMAEQQPPPAAAALQVGAGPQSFVHVTAPPRPPRSSAP